MKDATPRTVSLETAKVKFLEEMATKHGLPDVDKAVRCLVDYARDNPDRHATIFGEIRCHDC